MKMVKIGKNDKFLVMPLKHVSGLTFLVKCPGTLKLWAIAQEKDQKSRKRRVFVLPYKHVSGHAVLVNRLGTLKLWAIAKENGQKLLKRTIFGHASKT